MDEAIVLCGGLGSRLRSVVSDVPKPMAQVAGRPFLEYLLEFLRLQAVRRVILAVGYKREVIIDHFGESWGGLDIDYAVETEPRGTGGGTRLAVKRLRTQSSLLLNGDSFLARPTAPLERALSAGADLVLTVRPEPDTGRFGVCELQGAQLTGFRPGVASEPGLINAGVYALRRGLFDGFDLPEAFSFEHDFLAPFAGRLQVSAVVASEPFIDIGLPESYALAQSFVPAASRGASQQDRS
jgi:D-glycero-alpha-D-manno-heptose 1-phosphate guanylyltransferase